jgi:hypothetical protein
VHPETLRGREAGDVEMLAVPDHQRAQSVIEINMFIAGITWDGRDAVAYPDVPTRIQTGFHLVLICIDFVECMILSGRYMV